MRGGMGLGLGGGGTPPTPTIGGIAVGAAGSSGIYSSYTMVGGDDFDGSAPDVLRAAAPYAKYFPTHTYGPGCRSVNGILAKSYDLDPYHTGSQDSNRGVAIGGDSMRQSGSVLTLQNRRVTAGETPHTNGRLIAGAMVDSGGYLSATAPCIIEAYVSHTAAASNPQGWHPTFWVMQQNPLYEQFDNPGQVEVDLEASSNQVLINLNIHGTVAGAASTPGPQIAGVMGTGFHLYSVVMTATDIKVYCDGVLKNTFTMDATVSPKPYRVIFTAHTYNASYGGDANVSDAAWAADADGATMSVDYYRIWVPTANTTKSVSPSSVLPTVQANFNTPLTYTFPSTTTLYGSALTDYVQAVKFEDFEPGSSTEAGAGYVQWPSGLSYNSGTRTLSGTISDKPGRIHLMSTPYVAGGVLCKSARGYIDIGPRVTTTTINGDNGVAVSYDLYPDCDVGTLLPKVITCTGLPTGLSFNATTGLITGTPTVNGTYTVNIGVTNSAGQTASTSISYVINTAATPANTVAPVASGNTVVGSTLTTTNGTWTNSPTGYTYQWQKAGVNISGETASTYVSVSGDIGSAITCNVTATNAAGSTTASSNGITVTATVSLAIDGTNSATGTLQTVPVSLTTTNANCVLVVLAKGSASTDGAVTGVTDSSGLTWTKRKSMTFTTGSTFETWYAIAPTAGTRTISVTYAVNTGLTKRITAYGVVGANTAAPWDTNVSLPNTNSNASANTLSTSSAISTTATDTILLAHYSSANALSTVTRPSGWSVGILAGTTTEIDYKVVSAAQSSITLTFSWTGTAGAIAGIFDAIKA